MPVAKSSLRRRALHVVIVLIIFYPLGVYVYTHSVNRATTHSFVIRNVDDGLRYCIEVKAALEELLAATPGEPAPAPDASQWLRAELQDPAFARRLQRLLYSGNAPDVLVRFVQLQDGNTTILHLGQEPPARFIGEVTIGYPIDLAEARDRVLAATQRGSAVGICKVVLPIEFGKGHEGRLVVGLASPNIGSQLAALSERLSMRALRLSLIGTSLLALFAAYIVYLNDRTRQLELKLEQEKRLAYVGTIAAGVAHEIRNPLNSIKMNIQLIENHLAEFGRNDYLVNKVSRIHQETARLEESVNNFLAFARPKPLRRRQASLNKAINDVIEFLEPACQNDGIRVVRDFSHDLPDAYIDPEQLGQAVENLIRNAHQAIGKDGIIEIYTGRSGDHIEIRVSDDGPGIPPDVADKVFDIFFTTKQSGSGLGLTIVKQIVEAHDGSVTFDTIEKRGTTFTIRLPIGEPP